MASALASEFEGEPIGPRDVLAVGEDFVDLHCPLLLLPLGDDEHLPIQVVAVGEVGGKILVALPGSAWHRKVAKRTAPKGLMTRVFAAEVATCALSDHSFPVEGQVLRIWLGHLEPSGEELLEVSEDQASVVFGTLPSGEPLVPFVTGIWRAQLQAGTPVQTASETEGLSGRVAGLERSLQELTQALTARASTSCICNSIRLQFRTPVQAWRQRCRAPPASYPSLDPSVVQAALAASVEHHALLEMQRMISKGPLSLPSRRVGRGRRTFPGGRACRRCWFSSIAVKCSSSRSRGSGLRNGSLPRRFPEGQQLQQASIEPRKGLRGAGGSGSRNRYAECQAKLSCTEGLEGCAPSQSRRHFVRHRASDDGGPPLIVPGVAFPAQTSARAWLEHRSRVGAYPTVVNLTWCIAGALDSRGLHEQALPNFHWKSRHPWHPSGRGSR